jgi:hypothetical protein
MLLRFLLKGAVQVIGLELSEACSGIRSYCLMTLNILAYWTQNIEIKLVGFSFLD